MHTVTLLRYISVTVCASDASRKVSYPKDEDVRRSVLRRDERCSVLRLDVRHSVLRRDVHHSVLHRDVRHSVLRLPFCAVCG